jgi:hypothetical protein
MEKPLKMCWLFPLEHYLFCWEHNILSDILLPICATDIAQAAQNVVEAY